jgi:hypothetical protein
VAAVVVTVVVDVDVVTADVETWKARLKMVVPAGSIYFLAKF